MKNLMYLFEALQTIAINNPAGYSVDAKTLQPIKEGFAVSVAETQNSFGSAGLAKVIVYVSKHPEINAFGGWKNEKNGMFYFDATIICKDRETAIKLAKENKQLAIYDLNTGTEINL